jgi:hypothetical protein
MTFSGSTGAEVHIAKIPAIFIKGVTLRHGGSVSLDYDLATEAIESLIRLLVVTTKVRDGRPVDPDELDGREPRMRKIVDGLVHTKLEPLLREVIVQNKNAVPGIDLAQALGL